MKGDYTEALRLWTRLIKSGLLKKNALAQAYINRGLSHEKLNNKTRAERDLRKAASLDPSLAMAHLMLAELWTEQGKRTKALPS